MHNAMDVREQVLRDIGRVMGGLQRVCAATLRTPQDGEEVAPRMLEQGDTLLFTEIMRGQELKNLWDQWYENRDHSVYRHGREETRPEQLRGAILCEACVQNECQQGGRCPQIK